METTDLQIELELELFKATNPHLRKKEESYRDDEYDEAEKTLEVDVRIIPDALPLSSADDMEESRRRLEELQAKVRQNLELDPQPVKPEETPPTHEEWEDVPLGGDDHV